MQQLGKYLLIIGLLLAVVGGVMWLLGNKLHCFGNLPGDIRVERENFKFYFPITTMILLSVLVSLLIWIFRRYF